MTTKTREVELQYQKEKRDRLCLDEPVNQVEVDILTDRIWELLEEMN